MNILFKLTLCYHILRCKYKIDISRLIDNYQKHGEL